MLIFASIAIFKVLVRHFLILLALLLPLFVSGQDPYYTPITKANGLPTNTVYFLFQDSKGFIWMAHDEGLSRYDGFEFRNYGSEVQSSRAGTDIKEDKYGRIWYTNFDGYLFYVENGVMKRLKQNISLGYIRYAIIDDRLMVMQAKGLDIYSLADLKLIRTVLINTSTLGKVAYGADGMYMSCEGACCLIDKNGNIVSRTRDVNKGFFFPSGKGIVSVDRDNKWGYFEYSYRNYIKRIQTKAVKFIQGYVFTGNRHWLCTTNGLWAYDSSGNELNNGAPLFVEKNITGVLVDNEGNHWISTLNEGVLFIPDINTRLVKGGFMANNLLQEGGQVFVTTKKNSIYNYDGATGQMDILYKDSIEHPVYAFIKRKDGSGYILISSMFIFLDQHFKKKSILANAFKDIEQIDNKYCAYAGSGNSGLVRLHDDIPSEWDSLYSSGLVLNMANAVRLIPPARGRLVEWIPRQKTIYFAANNGLFKATPHLITEVTWKDEMVIAASICVIGDTLFAVTMQNELLKVVPGKAPVELSLGEKGLELYKIKNVNGVPVLVTNKGIRELILATGRLGNSYTTSIPGEEVNDIVAIGDRLLVATDKGLFMSQSTEAHNTMPVLRIHALTANGKGYDPSGDHTFSHKENDIEVRYSILSYRTGGNYRLYYSISGGNWQLTGDKSRSLKLASLAPGSYTISFRFAGVTEQQNLSFEITKPLWMRWWFLALTAIVLLAIGITYYKWQTGLLKKKNLLLVEKVKLEKSLHSSMLTSIKSQMNPHFFYNALNTIQSYIFSDDKRNATTYLSKFSKLTRTILEMSEKETVSLSEEISALTLYLDLEKARFNDALSFSIHTSPGLDADNIKLPSMIIQPYVENSIKHGLLHQKGEKTLTLNFEVKDNDLCVTIDDSGIGRKKSEELNKIRTDKHRPFATDANLKRIEILNKGKENIGVKYIDKVNDLGQATGTTLIITIPLVKATTHVH